ncbi:ATP-binding protein [Saliterribacillus persicus]|uniref:histidine kinase n=1 Tax=Saliterribacillus persicus TaxID=930114 RepID=A0A368XU99_9BACI|nr:ATP-binding protein [Saliterribacillus persicus]RCW70608.1 two-component system sporulation sensor kinase A [Saliterribacillus persicus]
MNDYVDQNEEDDFFATPINTELITSLPREVLSEISKNLFDLIIICDEKKRIIFISDSVKYQLNYRKEEIIGHFFFDFIPRSDKKNLYNKFDNNYSGQQKFYFRLKSKMDKYILFESNVVQIMDEEEGNKIVAVSKNITDKKIAEEMMIRSEKMSVAGQLAAGIAHEIRNPLTSIKGFLQLMQAGVEGKEAYHKIMTEEIEKIEAITTELLFISKPMTDEKTMVDVKSMIEDVVVLLQTQASLYGITISVNSFSNKEIYCDRSQIKQVLINLIKNAIEAMEDNGYIWVDVSYTYATCAIKVIDEGPGIPHQMIEKLKEPFFTTKKNGTGLGLMICNQIIENHQGVLNISGNKDKGSTFEIILPIM